MERKERNAEGKTSAYQALFQLCFTKFSQKSIHIKCYYLQKRKSLFKNDFFKGSLKNIPKGVRSTKMSSCSLT